MKKVLVVDRDEDILYTVKILLTDYGFEVLTHSTGLHVHKIVKNHKPNIILLSIQLPGKAGTQVCKELKEKHNIPILLFSADVQKRKNFAEFNADGFVEKPFDITDLVNTISLHLNNLHSSK